MIQPKELKAERPMEVANGVMSTTHKVWEILNASYAGDLPKVKELVMENNELVYAQYNYMPPIHLAVREGFIGIVRFLLSYGAYSPAYRTYPFQDNLLTIASDRNYLEIATLLEEYESDPSLQKYGKDNGTIVVTRNETQKAFQDAVDKNDLTSTNSLLQQYPDLVYDEDYFWGEGILMMPAKENHRNMIDLLMSYGARVPNILKWAQAYYFKSYEGASYMMEKGMNPNVMSCHHVTILHDMAQKGNLSKAELLLNYGADINALDEEYCSTPLGLAARWGQTEMVKFLLQRGADPLKAGAAWATPLVWAQKKEFEDITRMLFDSGAK